MFRLGDDILCIPAIRFHLGHGRVQTIFTSNRFDVRSENDFYFLWETLNLLTHRLPMDRSDWTNAAFILEQKQKKENEARKTNKWSYIFEHNAYVIWMGIPYYALCVSFPSLQRQYFRRPFGAYPFQFRPLLSDRFERIYFGHIHSLDCSNHWHLDKKNLKIFKFYLWTTFFSFSGNPYARCLFFQSFYFLLFFAHMLYPVSNVSRWCPLCV